MMKKQWIVLLIALVLVLAACGNTTKEEPKDATEKNNQTEEKENKQNEEIADEEEESQETTIEKKESEGTDATDSNDANEGNNGSSDAEENGEKDDSNASENEEDDDAGEESADDDIVEFGFSIFEAQANKDYDYLASVLSKGSTLNKDKNTIQFDDVTYPHEYEFISEKDFKNLDERYIHDEDDGSVIVGYAVVDYETESSYIIDAVFIKEDGKWKVNDMDINK